MYLAIFKSLIISEFVLNYDLSLAHFCESLMKIILILLLKIIRSLCGMTFTLCKRVKMILTILNFKTKNRPKAFCYPVYQFNLVKCA